MMEYIVERVPAKYAPTEKELEKELYYCHMKGYGYIPVFGSIGDKKKATEVCRIMNLNRGINRMRGKG